MAKQLCDTLFSSACIIIVKMVAQNMHGNVSTVVINGSRRVTITPSAPQTQASPRPPVVTHAQSPLARPAQQVRPPVVPVINKILLKVMSRGIKGDFKMFTLRNINPTEISTVFSLSQLMRTQLKGNIIEEDFDVGYISGNNLISFRNREDVSDIWAVASKGGNIVVWCDGLKSSAGAGKNRKATDHNQRNHKMQVIMCSSL